MSWNRTLYRGPDLDVLHEDYAKRGRIDEHAPVKTRGSVVIAAPPHEVWALLTDPERWPAIEPSFRAVRLASTVAVDERFRFTLNGFPIRARFAVVRPERELSWTGASLWFRAIDRHVLEPAPDGGTELHLAESFAGYLASLLVSSARLRSQHDAWLASLRRVAEGG